jgi:hypothetical protein
MEMTMGAVLDVASGDAASDGTVETAGEEVGTSADEAASDCAGAWTDDSAYDADAADSTVEEDSTGAADDAATGAAALSVGTASQLYSPLLQHGLTR